MFNSNTKAFLKHIEFLTQNSPDKIIEGFRGLEKEKDFITKIIADTRELIDHNESTAGLEILLSNLHEVDFNLDATAITLAKAAIKECKMKYQEWAFIEELQK